MIRTSLRHLFIIDELEFIKLKVIFDKVVIALGFTKYRISYSGAGNRGSTAAINTLSISSGISLPRMVPEVYRQGFELASISKGFSSSSNMKSRPNNFISNNLLKKCTAFS